MVDEERIRASVWLVVLGVLATAATLTYLAIASAPTNPSEARVEPAVHEGRPRGSTPHSSHRSSSRAWGEATGPVDAGVALPPEVEEALRDPQLAASHRSYPEQDGGVSASFAPMMRIAHVTQVAGNSEVTVGQRCEVRVLPVRSGGFNCLARVQCGNALLYPDSAQRAGYVSCELSSWGYPSRAQDFEVTGDDGDPALLFDLPNRRIEVRDDGPMGNDFSAVLRIDALPRFTRRGEPDGDNG